MKMNSSETICLNAKKLLIQIMRKRNWHQIKHDKILQRKAAMDKTLLLDGRLSYEKCCQWLEKLGYRKVQDEVWENRKS